MRLIQWGDKDWWWSIINIDLDAGLFHADISGKSELMHLDDCKCLRIGLGDIIKNEDFTPSQKEIA